MSKNIIDLLKKLGFENPEEVATKLGTDEGATLIDQLLTQAQKYSRPFIETELNEKFKTERGSLKGKYFQEAARKVNKIFGNKLTNKELEDIINDPENDGKTFDAVVEDIKEKTADKGGKTEVELQKMLDASNGKISDLETQLTEAKAKYEKDLADGVSKVKRDATLARKLSEILPKFTSMNPAKAAELIQDKLHGKATIKVNEKGELTLHDPSDAEKPLKKDATNLQTFEGLVGDLAKEYELPVAKSGGTRKTGADDIDDKDSDPKNKLDSNSSAKGLAAALEAAAGA